MAIEITSLRNAPVEGLDWEECLYNGLPVGDLFFGEDKGFDRTLSDLMEQEPAADGFVQDSYLGYDEAEDAFVVGYDLNRGGGYHIVKITIKDGQPILSDVSTHAWATKPFYDDLYDRLKSARPNLIDLRLD